jgi:hypothetical protein
VLAAAVCSALRTCAAQHAATAAQRAAQRHSRTMPHAANTSRCDTWSNAHPRLQLNRGSSAPRQLHQHPTRHTLQRKQDPTVPCEAAQPASRGRSGCSCALPLLLLGQHCDPHMIPSTLAPGTCSGKCMETPAGTARSHCTASRLRVLPSTTQQRVWHPHTGSGPKGASDPQPSPGHTATKHRQAGTLARHQGRPETLQRNTPVLLKPAHQQSHALLHPFTRPAPITTTLTLHTARTGTLSGHCRLAG